MELQPDQLIAHYRLIEKIGAGGMGIVWSAQDTRLKRQVAIKILPPELTADTERRLRFQREAQTAAGLSHPNIAVIHEVGEHEGVPYLVMELIKGRTLRDVVGKRALPVKDWLQYAVPIAAALAHAHEAGIIHRDLKSSNVMVTDDGHVKLLDFGLAKLLDPKPGEDADPDDIDTRLETISRELTQAGKVVGTVAYMSPEQARGDPVDHRSDIFSFGVLLYELATGQFPFRGSSDIESLNNTLSYDPPPLSQVVGEVPGEAERIVTKALEKEPNRRYQTAADMGSDFRNLKRDLDTGKVSIPGRSTVVSGAAPGAGAPDAMTTGTGPQAAPSGSAPGTMPTPGATLTPDAAGPTASAPHTGVATTGRFRPWMAVVTAVIVVGAVIVGLQLRPDGDSVHIPEVAITDKGVTIDGKPVLNTDQLSKIPEIPRSPAGAGGATRVVVLPFENLGAAEDEYFASGVTEEIIGRLTSVRDLAVISRSSAFNYDRTGKTIRQIGEDFDVDYVLDGTVRWARAGDRSRVRIAPELVRVSDDTGVWGETYDADMDDIFQVQSDIAGKVIGALGVVLGAGDRESLASAPTGSQEAYRAYLKGREALLKEPNTELAEQMFERAVELDPEFYQAWAGLSRAHSWRHHGGDRTSGRCDAAKKTADQALRLAPEAPDSRMALSLYYYRCFRDYDRALAELAVAERDRPNDTDIIGWKATFHKRQGNLEEALRLHRRVVELDPMDVQSASELGTVYMLKREYPQAVEALNRAIAIAPDVPTLYGFKFEVYLIWKGAVSEARAAIDAMPQSDSDSVRLVRFWAAYFVKEYEKALSFLDKAPALMDDQTTLHARPALAALCYEGLGDDARARTLREEAVSVLQKRAAEAPEDFRAYCDLGPILAALGRREEAIAAAKRATELMPPTKDAEAAVVPGDNLVMTYAILGDYDTAFDMVEERLTVTPGKLSIPVMRADLRWKGMVEHPKFAALAKRFDIDS